MQIGFLFHPVHLLQASLGTHEHTWIPGSFSSVLQERCSILFPLSCQASKNSFHGLVLLTFLTLGTCKCRKPKLHCCRCSPSGADLQAQAEAAWHCPCHPAVGLPLVLLRSLTSTLFSNSTLKLFWKVLWPVCPWWRRWCGWDNCMGNLHVPHSTDFMSGIKHHPWTWLIRAAQSKHKPVAGSMHQVWDHPQTKYPGLFQEVMSPVENRDQNASMLQYQYAQVEDEEDRSRRKRRICCVASSKDTKTPRNLLGIQNIELWAGRHLIPLIIPFVIFFRHLFCPQHWVLSMWLAKDTF